jgi:hypothetical protein
MVSINIATMVIYFALLENTFVTAESLKKFKFFPIPAKTWGAFSLFGIEVLIDRGSGNFALALQLKRGFRCPKS